MAKSWGNHPENHGKNQKEFQDPRMEVLYHISGHILWGYFLKFSPYIMVIEKNWEECWENFDFQSDSLGKCWYAL
jgi:hypothetical protein